MGNRIGRSFVHDGSHVWKIAGVVVLAAVTLSFAGFALVQRQAPVSPTALYTPPPAGEVAPVEVTDVAVVGDSFTGGSGMDSGAPARWPANLSGFSVTTYHEGGTGYAATLDSADGPSNFMTRVEQMPADGVDNLVFFGSINDGRLGYQATYDAAAATYAAAQIKWPDARILVIGPASPKWPVPAEFTTSRDAVRDAASSAGVAFFDPIDARWFEGSPELIGSDGTHPTDAGHAYLAQQMEAVLELQLLG
ncbi:SGNH/GDSL hydrolase family protein [Microbacterium sp. VKM Ac-2923]|uniref:SGNH/GDSL hydrolase family protein n=1 Tax=Microbacterium sp. VKM Ac-2923 TaxID=2929476 RepID=UPI001FB28BD3|nr:SGNH/GDSL hydrolase family protein [Microbacterium sp. VKM Ac-2923]MCJ1709216.1 SGNH/GDSL hydrolase family protein [Microbacterium sp. VKM Ac-2923]